MALTKVRVFEGNVTADKTGVGAASGTLAAWKESLDPKGVVGKVVGACLNVTAHVGATGTLDVKVQGTCGETPAIVHDLITFTQVTTTDGSETKGLNTAWLDILNPSVKNPGGVDVPQRLRVNVDVGGTDPDYTLTVDLLIMV